MKTNLIASASAGSAGHGGAALAAVVVVITLFWLFIVLCPPVVVVVASSSHIFTYFLVEMPVESLFFCKDSSSVGRDFSSEHFLVENVSSENVWILRILLVEVEMEMCFERFIR